MPNLSRLIPPRVMPPHHAAVNRGHPLGQGMTFCYLMNGGPYSFIDACRLHSAPTALSYAGGTPTKASPTGSNAPMGTVYTQDTSVSATITFGRPWMTEVANVTLEAWFGNMNLASGDHGIIGIGQCASGTDGYAMQVDSGGTAQLYCGGVATVNLGGSMTSGPSYHMVFTRDAGGTWRAYINGVPTGTTDTTTPNTPTTRSMLLRDDFGVNYWRNGWVAYARGWNRCLSLSQIGSLYQDPFQMFHGVTMPRRSFATTTGGGGGSTASLAWHVA